MIFRVFSSPHNLHFFYFLDFVFFPVHSLFPHLPSCPLNFGSAQCRIHCRGLAQPQLLSSITLHDLSVCHVIYLVIMLSNGGWENRELGFWFAIYLFVFCTELMSDQTPRGYRPIAPRTRLLKGGDGGEAAGSSAGRSAPEEKRMRRASTACTECQKRRTRVHIHYTSYSFPLTSPPSIWSTLHY